MRTKIAIVSGFYPPSIGGMEKQLASWARVLSEAGHSVNVHTSAIFAPEGTSTSNSLRVIRHGDSLKEWSLAAAAWLNQYCDSRTIVIVASLGTDTAQAMLQCLILAHQKGARVVMRVPTSDHVRRASSHTGGNDFLARVDRYITNSFDSVTELRKTYDDVVYVPNHLPSAEVLPLDAPLPQRRSVGYFGRMSARKRIDILPSVMEYLPADVEMFVQGPPGFGEDEFYQNLKTKLHRARIQMFQAAAKPVEEVANSMVFINPSEAEGCSNAVLEAMNRGSLPVVSDLPENRSILGGLGWLCAPEPYAYARAVTEALNHPERAERQRELRQRIISSFSEEVIAKKLMDALLKGWQ